MWLRIVEFVLLVLALGVLYTQVLYPLWIEMPLFPLFRDNKKLEKKLSEAKEGFEGAKIREEIVSYRRKAKKISNKEQK